MLSICYNTHMFINTPSGRTHTKVKVAASFGKGAEIGVKAEGILAFLVLF